MSRLTLTLDRIATLLVGLVILAAGLYALVWWQDRATTIPARLHTSVLNDVTAEGWWPWAAAIGGLVLVFVGVRWLAAHLPRRSLPAFRLPGSSPRGRLQIESSAVADAAARELSAAPGVRSVRARLVQDRGQDVLSMHGQIDSDADLVALGHAADAISRNVARAAARDDLRCRIQLGVHRGR